MRAFFLALTLIVISRPLDASTSALAGGWSGTAGAATVPFGGTPYCNYTVTMQNVSLAFLVDADGNVSSVSASADMVENTVGLCALPPLPANTHRFTGTGSVSGDNITLTLVGSPDNQPQDAGTFSGTLVSGEIRGTLTFTRNVADPSLQWQTVHTTSLTDDPLITITTDPPGLQIMVTVNTIFSPLAVRPHTSNTVTAPDSFTAPAGTSITIGAPSPQGSGATQYVYQSWSDHQPQTHTFSSPATSTTYTAFYQTLYQLNITVTPPGAGTVSATAFSSSSSSGGFYNAGTSVQLTATPKSGFQFNGFSGDLSGGSPQSIVMNAPHNVTAHFGLFVPCAFGITPGSASFGTAGANGNTVTVTPSGNCGNWSSSGVPNWIVVTNGSGGGNAPGSFTYNVLPNTGKASRSATFTIAGQSFTVTQAGNGCLVGFMPTSAQIGAAGGSFSFNVVLSGADCSWTASSNASWAAITGSNIGTGNGTISYQVQNNQAAALQRAGAITVTTTAGTQSMFNITQAGSQCFYSLPQSSMAFLASGGSGTAAVSATPGCAWTVSNAGAPFVTITAGGNGSGNGTVSFTVPGTAAARSGTLMIAGHPFLVTQSAPGNNTSCTAAVASPAQAPLEGRTVLLSDMVITCSGLSSAVSASVNLTLNTDVTNLLSGTNTVDAKLVVGNNSVNGQIVGYSGIQWPGLTIGPGTAVMRITNVKADASLLTAGGSLLPQAVTGQVSVFAGTLTPLAYMPQMAGGACAAAPAGSLEMACASPTLLFQKGQLTNLAGVQTLIPAVFQESVPGVFSTGSGGTTATRLRAVLSGIPASVKVYAPLVPQEGPALATLISADANGQGGSTLGVSAGAPCTCAQLTVTNGTAVATWVVNGADPATISQYTFPLLVTTVSPGDLNAMQLAGSLAPVSTVAVASATAPIPRYRDFSVPQALSDLRIARITIKIVTDPAGNQTASGTITIESVGGNTGSGNGIGGGGSGGPQTSVGGNTSAGPCTVSTFMPPPEGGSTDVQFSCPDPDGSGSVNVGLEGGDPPGDPGGSMGSTPIPLAIQLDAFPAGVGLQVDCDNDPPAAAPQICSWNPGETHTIGVGQATQTLPVGVRGMFNNWSDNLPASHPITVDPTVKEYAATFTTQYLLSYSSSPANGGTVTATASADGSAYYDSGSTVSLTATAKSGFQFTSWLVDGTPNPANPLQLKMSNTHTVTANFTGNGTQGGGGPSVVGVSPASGNGPGGNFTFQYAHSAGVQSLSVLNVLINKALDGGQACYLAYEVSISALHLVADAGPGATYAGTVMLGNPNTAIQNSQCVVNLISANAAGTTLTLVLNIAFKSGFGGNKVQYAAAGDTNGVNTGWQEIGVWQPSAPSTGTIGVLSASPARSTAPTGTAQPFTFEFLDTTNSLSDFGVLNVLVNNFIDGRNACYLAYVPSTNSLFLVDDGGDAGGPYAGGMVLNGASATVQNSQCRVSGAGSVVTTGTSSAPAGATITLTLNITFKAAFAGNRILFLAGRNAAGLNSTDWQALGTVLVQ